MKVGGLMWVRWVWKREAQGAGADMVRLRRGGMVVVVGLSCALLVVGCWMLDCWFLTFGCWRLVAGVGSFCFGEFGIGIGLDG